MPDKEKKIALRLPAALAEEIEALADRQQRSVNGQIVYLLSLAVKHWAFLAERDLAEEQIRQRRQPD